MKTRLFVERQLVDYYQWLMTEAEPLRAELEAKLESGGCVQS
jgi:hypothetical protein